MSMAIQAQQPVAQKQAIEKKEGVKKENTGITFAEWWSGEKSLTSTAARYVGMDSIADWLEDKDKVCTDGKDDGKVGLWEGIKSFGKGLLGGIPKAIIQHPLITGVTVAAAAGLTAITGGAAAPILWGLGAVLTAGSAGHSLYKAATAKTDGEMKAALEGTGTATAAAAMLGVTYGSTMTTAKNAGVNTDGNILQTMKSSAEISSRNAKANYMTWKTGAIHPNSNKLQGAHEYTIKGDEQTTAAFKVVPEGTKVQTVDGVRTVQTGEVIAIDNSGNLCITTPKNITNNASNLSLEAQRDLFSTLGYKPYNDSYCQMVGDPWDDHFEFRYFKNESYRNPKRINTTREHCNEYDYYKAANIGEEWYY